MLGAACGIVLACSCAEHTPTCQEYWQSSDVFSGIVTEISSASQGALSPGSVTSARHELSVRVAVDEKYRDTIGSEVVVSTGLGGGDCGFPFERGEAYLVYAYLNPESQQLETSICTLTKRLADAQDDLSYIKGASAVGEGTELYGRVLDYTRSAAGTVIESGFLAGANVKLEGPKGSLKIASDENGRYSWRALPAGKYTIAASLPNYTRVGSGEPAFELTGKGCREFTLLLQLDGQVSGRVLSADGQPIARQGVELVDVRGNGLAELHSETDTDGVYHFSGVRPGDYFVGVNLSSVPNASHPYLKTYTPSSQDSQSAAIVHLAKAEAVDGQDIIISLRTESREVKGHVTWPDGKPAENASISLMYPDYPWTGLGVAQSDSTGNFSTEVRSNLRTKIQVQAKNSAGIWLQAGEVEVPLVGPIKPMTFVLSHEPSK
jgi:hypothetical protein